MKIPLTPECRLCHVWLPFLFTSPGFDKETYKYKDSPLLAPPPPVFQLPCGHHNRTKQYILRTVHIEEASYDWNNHTFCAEDYNAFDWLDFLVPGHGWLHVQMCMATSLHMQYYGTRSGFSLVHAIDVLGWKYLSKVSTQGPFHHHLHEALAHIGEAHFADLWCIVGRVHKLGDLGQKRPEELLEWAGQIVQEHACMQALVRHNGLPSKQQDQVRWQMIQWNHDILYYCELNEAIRQGDVGQMEDLLPQLLFCFAGGKNFNYAIVLLKMMQGLHHELSEDAWWVYLGIS
ncbi:hypothetical protein K439DRAFT_1646609 [Ramaria rubella]|nr:hypothetical protein K439DRAFT_1646609 [Ramaria rubella]